jgi:hypothetical protein
LILAEIIQQVSYAPFHWNSSLLPQDVEISDDVFLIQRELAQAYKSRQYPQPDRHLQPGAAATTVISGATGIPASIPRLVWNW